MSQKSIIVDLNSLQVRRIWVMIIVRVGSSHSTSRACDDVENTDNATDIAQNTYYVYT